jgi:type 1 glutamine amidotransferase
MSVRRALLLAGGWQGHEPDVAADFVLAELLTGFEVIRERDLRVLQSTVLSEAEVLLPIWTLGELTETQESALCGAVEQGLGLVAWHGAASAFQASRRYKQVLGGQFMAHPGGDQTRYLVRFADDPLTAGLSDCWVTSEQYYLMVDPGVSVLATTTMVSDELPWLKGVVMPVAWRRTWGRGRVFYCALGHQVSVLRLPPVHELLRRAVDWAARTSSR